MNAVILPIAQAADRRPTIARTTVELKIGDVLHCHNSRFVLVGFAHSADDAARYVEHLREFRSDRSYLSDAEFETLAEREANLRAFRTEYLGPVRAGEPEAIPASWRRDWTVQGNHLAHWAVEVDGGGA